MKKLLSLAFLAVLGWSSLAHAGSNPETLRVALLPDENAATVIKNNRPLEEYLEKTLGREIELIVTTDYSSMIEAMRFGRLELAYFGPLSYTLARTKADIEPFAALMKDGETTYRAVVVANAEAGIESLEDAKGKKVAFGDVASTSSHLIPKSMLLKAGVEAGKDYSENFVGSHDAVAIAVQNGNAQIGGLSLPIYNSMVARGTIDPKKVIALAESDPFPQYPWTMRSDLDTSLKEAITKAFIDLKDEKVLASFKADGFAPIDDKAYDVVRELGKVLNLDLSQ
ncbi:phosphate/phosphite/phosphonate ABC transporter substrate-binding protein [Martelella sp. AD-3]|uniref:phosphate/phosphite/phosphonate ABC transporter substrate-binding protein n=1 Tax=Martelella sp. AD-3 TaxID=686597 RepID=UPI000465CF6A|nr:phosphate/phosphite/phosphonate ABC transporter substrate-binding protein [Martelella sp. AD-3]AMM87341.1 phosphate ABC transporter substrate-binding protein [Martelella sp. AD-3]